MDLSKVHIKFAINGCITCILLLIFVSSCNNQNDQKPLVGYITQSGEYIATPQFQYGGDFHEGMAWVALNDKRGYIDKSGEVIVEPQFEIAGDFSQGFAWVVQFGKRGFIDMKGDMMLKPQFDYVQSFSENRAAILIPGKKWGYINTNSELVIDPIFSACKDFHSGFAAVKKDSLWGYIDPAGNELIHPQFQEANDFFHSRALIKFSGKYGYIDMSGEMIIQPQFENAGSFRENLANVMINNQWGYIDTAGNVIIEFQFVLAEPFYESAARVYRKDMALEYIGLSGQPLFQATFERGGDFSGGLAWVVKNGETFYIDKTGKKVIASQEFKELYNFSEGIARVKASQPE